MASAYPTVRATAPSLDFSPRMTSTRGILWTGLKKCMPQKFSGRFSPSPRRVMEIVDVLLARTASCCTRSSTSASTDFLIFSFSTTASTTRSTPSKSP